MNNHLRFLFLVVCSLLLLVTQPGCEMPPVGSTGAPPPAQPGSSAGPLEFHYKRVTNPPGRPGSRIETMNGHSYAVEDVVVTSRDHLLQLMGSPLSDGQQELVRAYDHAHSGAMVSQFSMSGSCGVSGRVPVNMYDTTFVQGVSQDTLRNDFWPHAHTSSPLYIRLSTSSHVSGSSRHMEMTLAHEFAHILDRVLLMGRASDYYGPDGKHYIDERIHTNAAFTEGWAIFNEWLQFPGSRTSNPPSSIRFEGAAGQYSMRDTRSSSVTGQDMISVEQVVAGIMYTMATTIPDGQNKVLQTFIRTNRSSSRDLASFVKSWMEAYPGDIMQVMRIFDQQTLYKFSNADLQRMFPMASGYISQRSASPAATAYPQTPAPTTGPAMAPAGLPQGNPPPAGTTDPGTKTGTGQKGFGDQF